MFKPCNKAESLLALIKKHWAVLGLNFFGDEYVSGCETRDFGMVTPKPKNSKGSFLSFLFERPKFASLESLVGFLALVAGKLWPKIHKIFIP